MNFIIILFLTSISGLLIGVYIAKNLKQNEIFCDECIKMCDSFLIELKFKQDKIITILEKFKSKCKSKLKQIIENYINSLEEYKKFEIKIKLEEDIKVSLLDFFNALGISDTFTQVEMVENYKNRFEYFYKQKREKNNKFNSVYIKLGFFFGLAFGILII